MSASVETMRCLVDLALVERVEAQGDGALLAGPQPGARRARAGTRGRRSAGPPRPRRARTRCSSPAPAAIARSPPAPRRSRPPPARTRRWRSPAAATRRRDKRQGTAPQPLPPSGQAPEGPPSCDPRLRAGSRQREPLDGVPVSSRVPAHLPPRRGGASERSSAALRSVLPRLGNSLPRIRWRAFERRAPSPSPRARLRNALRSARPAARGRTVQPGVFRAAGQSDRLLLRPPGRGGHGRRQRGGSQWMRGGGV